MSKYKRECDICRLITDRRTMPIPHLCLDCAIALTRNKEDKAYYRYCKMWFEEHDGWKVDDNCRPVYLSEFLDNEYAESPELYL